MGLMGTILSIRGVTVRVSEYVRHDAVGLAELMARGEVSPAEVEAAAREAVRAVNPAIDAVVETWPADDRPAPGSTPLAGVPFLIKDFGISMAGRRTEMGSRLTAGHVARSDSFLMRRLRRAGLVTVGRTATPELAYSITTEPVLYGPTRNPWDPERGAGGSSGGAGAAVAAGAVPVAHATDAAGSLRIPAAYNGLFGLKPTRGRVSLGPALDEGFNGLAVQGGVSRTVRDSAALLDLIRGPEPGDPYFAEQPSRPYAQEVTRLPGPLRIGVLPQAWGGRRTAAPVAGALDRTVRLLESLGHRTEEVTVALGVGWEEFVLANTRLSTANVAASVDSLAAALGRPVDSSTLEPSTLAAHRYGRGSAAPSSSPPSRSATASPAVWPATSRPTTCCSPPPCRSFPHCWAPTARAPRRSTASAGSSGSTTTRRSPWRSTWRAPPPCPCR